MNHKILKLAKVKGHCCLWAYLDQNREVHTSELYKELEKIVTLRALQYARYKFRRGKVKCEELENCFKERVRLARRTL